MTILAIIVALLLAFMAFRFVAGMVKLAALALVVLAGILVAHRAGAF
jgi:hypothetical protein